jgi:hypothetical protein
MPRKATREWPLFKVATFVAAILNGRFTSTPAVGFAQMPVTAAWITLLS